MRKDRLLIGLGIVALSAGIFWILRPQAPTVKEHGGVTLKEHAGKEHAGAALMEHGGKEHAGAAVSKEHGGLTVSKEHGGTEHAGASTVN